MAKIIKHKSKRRLNMTFVWFMIFFVVAIAWLAISLYTKTQNANLTVKIQKLNEELAELQNQNQSINIEIQTLENKDRLYVIAQSETPNKIEDNLASIFGE